MSVSKRLLVIFCGVLGLFFLLRGAWLGVEGLSGRLPLDWGDWIRVTLFVVTGIRLLVYVVQAVRKELFVKLHDARL